MEYALRAKNVCRSIYLSAGVLSSRNSWFVAYVGLFMCRQSVLYDLRHQKCSCIHQHINCLLDEFISENKYWKKNPWIFILLWRFCRHSKPIVLISLLFYRNFGIRIMFHYHKGDMATINKASSIHTWSPDFLLVCFVAYLQKCKGEIKKADAENNFKKRRGRSSYSLFACVHFRISKIISNLKITKIAIFSSPFSWSNSTKRKMLLFNSWYVTETRFFYEKDI